jgi:hypothetical protein
MATKTLRVTLADILGPAGPTGRVHGEVWAQYVDGNGAPREVRYTDGTVVVMATPRVTLDALGVADFVVVPSDDSTIHVDDRGFGVKIGWDLTERGPRGSRRQVPGAGKVVQVVTTDAAVVQFGAKAPYVPIIVGATYPTSGDVAVKVDKGTLVFNVKDYGAAGDDSTADTAAIQAAITAAAVTASGGLGATVFLPKGTYRTTGITLPDNVQLRGAGQRASRIKGIGAVTTLTIGTNCVVSDLQITGDATVGGKGLAATAASNHWSVVDCWVTGCETGVYLTNTYIDTLTRVTVQSCTTGIRLTGSNVNAIYVMNGEIKGCTDGVYADTGASTNVTFYGVTIEGNSGYGISQAGSPYGWKVRDCYFEANTSGHIYQTVQSRALTISGATFSGAAAFSIKLDAGIDTLIEVCTFNLAGTVGPAIQGAAAVQRTTVLKNWYAAGQEFVPATHYAGTLLTQIDREVRFPPSTTTNAGMNIPHGTAPTSPGNGDVWTTIAGVYARVNGSTKQLDSPPGVAPDQLEFMSTLGNHPAAAHYGNSSTTFSTANNAVLVKFRPFRDLTLTEVRFLVAATSTGNYDIGVYSSGGTLLWSKGSTAWPTVSTAAGVTVSPSLALTAGTDYWFALAGDNNTATWRGMVESSVDQVKMLDGTYFSRVVGSAFPLPSTITVGSTRAGKTPLIVLQGT